MNIKGRIDNVSRWFIRGWAFDKARPRQVIFVDIYINGSKKETVRANRMRKGLFDRKVHPTGKCGFACYIGDKYTLQNEDKISVRVADTELDHSPMHVSPVQIPLQEQANKTLIVGLGKSGTSKLTYMIAGGMASEPEVFFEPKGALGLEDIKQHREITSKSSVVHKSLYLHNKTIDFDIVSKLYDRKIWIVRDPRDRLISLLLYRWFRGHKPNPQKYKRTLALVKAKEAKPASVTLKELWEITIEKNTFKQKLEQDTKRLMTVLENLDSSWFIYPYREMVDGSVSDLEQYLGHKVEVENEVPDKFNRVVRSKAYGNWKDWFTAEDVLFFKPFLDPIIQKYNLGEANWSLHEKPQLDPEKGSVYMQKLFNPKS